MRSYIPKIEAVELSLLKKEVAGQYLCVAFDGTSRLGEAINITGRWCTETFHLRHRLLRFLTCKHHLKAAQLASMLTKVLLTELGIEPEQVVSFSRDSVAVNGAACRLLCSATFTCAESILCICHTLNNAGSQVDFPVLASFTTVWLDFVGGRHPHTGARDMWRSTVAPQVVPGFSNTRWFSKAEIQFVLAENFSRLPGFMARLEEHGYGDASRQKLRSFLDERETNLKLKLQLAAMLDLRQIVRTTYEMEGDSLEILLVYRRIEALRALGRAIESDGGATVLPNLDAALRSTIKLAVGTKISKFFQGFGRCVGKIISVGTFDSTLYPGQQRLAYTVKYASDGTTEDLEEEELRPLLLVTDLPQRDEITNGLAHAFGYLERRLNGDCDAHYDCRGMYEVSPLVVMTDT